MTKEKFIEGFSLIVANIVVAALAFAGCMWLLSSIGTHGVDKMIAYPFAGVMTFFLMKELVQKQLQK